MAPTRPTLLTPYTPYSYDTPTQQPAYNRSPSQPPPSGPLPAPILSIQPATLEASSFAPFGTVITSPLPLTTKSIPYPPPLGSLAANQGTALKYPSISAQTNSYHLSPSGSPAKPVTTMFSCFPRTLRTTGGTSGTQKKSQVFDVRILERHPYTSQTFIPLATASPSTSRAVIIVAPTLPSPAVSSSGTPYFPQATSISIASAQGKEGGMPDLANLKAFVAEPGQGVMYAAGTWHAPVVVVGEHRVDFVVNQWMSGKGSEDCQEVEIEEGLCVDLGENGDGERHGMWRKPRL